MDLNSWENLKYRFGTFLNTILFFKSYLTTIANVIDSQDARCNPVAEIQGFPINLFSVIVPKIYLLTSSSSVIFKIATFL